MRITRVAFVDLSNTYGSHLRIIQLPRIDRKHLHASANANANANASVDVCNRTKRTADLGRALGNSRVHRILQRLKLL